MIKTVITACVLAASTAAIADTCMMGRDKATWWLEERVANPVWYVGSKPVDESMWVEDYKACLKERKRAAAHAKAQAAKPGVQIGMSGEQVIKTTSWGRPDRVNRTTTTHGTLEQWVYRSGGYLYFRNGVLTTIQN